MISCVQLFGTPWTVACQAPLSMGILQTRILKCVAMSSSRGYSQLRGQIQVSLLQEDSLSSESLGKPKNTGVGGLFLLQGIFLSQNSNWGLLHCRWILYQLSYKGSLYIPRHQELNKYLYPLIQQSIFVIFLSKTT